MDTKVTEYIQKQASPQKEICQKLREIILKTFPDIDEEMKWGVPTYGLGKIYFVALKDHVNLGFETKNLSEKDLKLLEGTGKTMRHFQFSSIKQIDEDKVIKMLKLVESK